ncbi:uncharacterized protein LOC123396110 [Hordeum vulgare subsp. vulgare]|uniref:uncharacterized protein LOC123396110 n=1 Tax=Hordeum vulgare subsp. vulgare TaxID=112509 RepID=UPI001D1A3918|nr:uncharacterized protein LOC123396110 [Hordeum vulgare subsp. vulgare]
MHNQPLADSQPASLHLLPSRACEARGWPAEVWIAAAVRRRLPTLPQARSVPCSPMAPVPLRLQPRRHALPRAPSNLASHRSHDSKSHGRPSKFLVGVATCASSATSGAGSDRPDLALPRSVHPLNRSAGSRRPRLVPMTTATIVELSPSLLASSCGRRMKPASSTRSPTGLHDREPPRPSAQPSWLGLPATPQPPPRRPASTTLTWASVQQGQQVFRSLDGFFFGGPHEGWYFHSTPIPP